MTVIMLGQNFKYETEAVLKLFYPVRAFDFVFVGDGEPAPKPDGDLIILSRKIYSGYADLTAEVFIGGKNLTDHTLVKLESDDYEHLCELGLCRALFDCLKELTGISPEWGMLTGVRPVKLVSGLMKKGLSEEEIYSHMQGRLGVSREKIGLALKTAKNQEQALKALPKNGVSLYVSIPFCPSRCAYCSFVSQTVASFLKLIPEYVERLCDEIALTADIVRNLGLRLDTVYFGGGTPTSLSAGELERIMSVISERFDLSGLREYTVEAGRPDTVTEEKLSAIKRGGADRVSVNPQTLNQSVLDAIGRKHTVAQFFEAYDLAKKAGFGAINVDLIAGLPTDTLESFEAGLSEIIRLSPENITVHALSIKRSADLMQSGGELDHELAAKMISYSGAALGAAGYEPYYLYRQKNQLGNQENVGWERGGSLGIYNINMMEEVQTVLAVGAGGSTKIVADERNIRRLYNPKYPLEYLRRYDTTVAVRKREAERILREIRGIRNE